MKKMTIAIITLLMLNNPRRFCRADLALTEATMTNGLVVEWVSVEICQLSITCAER